jgi:hypothetical protein
VTASPYDVFTEHYKVLEDRYRAGGDITDRQVRRLRAMWEAVHPGYCPPPWEEITWHLGIEPGAEPASGKPRHRQADKFQWATFERLDELLAARKEALDTGGSIEGLSQAAIARELSALPGLNFDDTRVQRAEKVRNMCLEANVGDLRALLRSHPEFCVANGMWRLPTPEKVQRLLGL